MVAFYMWGPSADHRSDVDIHSLWAPKLTTAPTLLRIPGRKATGPIASSKASAVCFSVVHWRSHLQHMNYSKTISRILYH